MLRPSHLRSVSEDSTHCHDSIELDSPVVAELLRTAPAAAVCEAMPLSRYRASEPPSPVSHASLEAPVFEPTLGGSAISRCG